MTFSWHVLAADVVDGDTVDLTIDRGFYDQSRIRFRLKGVDTPEVFGVPKESEEFAAGKQASTFTTGWLESHLGRHVVTVVSFKAGSVSDGAFGGGLGDITCSCGANLARELVKAELAVRDS